MPRTYLGHVLPDRLDLKIDPARTALLIVDMQNDFVHDDGYCARSFGRPMVAGFQGVVPPIGRLAAAARAAGAAVLYCRVVQHPDGSLASPVWLADNLRHGFEPMHCMRGTWGWEIVDELTPQPGDVVFEKLRRSAFVGTQLENLLRSRDIRSLVVTGVAGTGCVESTVRDAIERDYFTVVPADCVANNTAELTAACEPAFRALLAPQDWTTSEQIVAVWAGSTDDPAPGHRAG
ncbi:MULTISPECIES: cysteine hydrolase family protein [unclassified Solwaraspora]|uniref:cysteine hydrolase family protein n=1 Tax=unclassified Solwaraspora TaxID=2627926 RepID=UPI00259AEC2D|nr:isochorismatase family cysteine hydrolase [Solwaraspora sp. WMMA2056]WJK38590.1 isochorismatase family cysteine hydrolase [Solwaraspora sp. WMMA2056]